MSSVPALAVAPDSGSEKKASSPASATILPAAPASVPNARSCIVCRNRKVRCDKQSPCSNCHRANIACVFPSNDRSPRWARRLERVTYSAAAASKAPPARGPDPGVAKVMDRLRNLENLVKELSGQLEQAHSATGSVGGGSPAVDDAVSAAQDHSPEQQRGSSSDIDTSSLQKQFGRMVLQDTSHSRYVSSGFWARVNDELDGLKMETHGLADVESDISEDEALLGRTTSTQELERTPSARHAFLFRHNLAPSVPDLHEFYPLPLQIPFLLDVYSENVNFLIQVVHIPTITKMIRGVRGSSMTCLTPANEALMFSIYYAAVTSMEENDITDNFGCRKSELTLKYRLGLEHALAKADFLNNPDMVLVQAFAIFLHLVRRYDNPRFVWMMTGLLIRMAQYLGLQRDGTHFEQLTPFEIETRRKVWWAVCALDLKASMDQGTDLTITSGSFDTKSPLNLNDGDIDPESKHMPIERDGVTDMSFARTNVELCITMRQMMVSSGKGGIADLKEQKRLVNEVYQKFEQGYLQYTAESGNTFYGVAVIIARLVRAKMTLIHFLPALLSSPNEHTSDEVRAKLLVSAVEVAEYNHRLNAEEAYRQWRWIFQTNTHWHAIVYLMIEVSRRPWSPIAERAWMALHSSWLIPSQASSGKHSRIWVPLRQLMDKARKHRNAELNRLRVDPQAAARRELDDLKVPSPSSSGPFSTGSCVDFFRERWRKLVAMPDGSGDGTQSSGNFNVGGHTDPSMHPDYATNADFTSSNSLHESSVERTPQPGYRQAGPILESNNSKGPEGTDLMDASRKSLSTPTSESSYIPAPMVSTDWSDGRTMESDFVPGLWADTDPSADIFANLNSTDIDMKLDGEVNWYNWIESAKGMDWDI